MSIIGEFCSGLQKLELYSSNVDRRQSDVMSELAALFAILRTTGPTLESIKICFKTCLSTKREFDNVREICPKLLNVEIKVRGDEAKSAYADFLRSYGSQRQYSDLGVISTVLCEEVAASCPNLRCALDRCLPGNVLMEKMTALGSCVESITVEADEFQDSRGTIDERGVFVSEVYSRLKHIQLFGSGDGLMRAITSLFSSVTPLLSTVEVYLDDSDASSAFLELSKHAATIRSFKFGGASQDAGAFDAIARASNSLQNVSIGFDNGRIEAEYRACVENAVSTFMDCPALRRLEFSDWPERENTFETISNKCRRLRLTKNHHLSVEVNKVEY